MYPIQKLNFSLSNSVKATFHHSSYKKAAHIHQLLEMVYIIDGEMLIKTRGKRIIAKKGGNCHVWIYLRRSEGPE